MHLKQAWVSQQFHAPVPIGNAYVYCHLPVLAQPKRLFAFLPAKTALLAQHGLTTHWSCTRNGYWSDIGYCCAQPPKKTPVLWPSDGEHPALFLCREVPLTAKALTARSEAA